MLALVIAALTAALPAPLKVRVLERAKPYEASLAATAVSCDGKRMADATVKLSLKDRRLQAQAQLCNTVFAEGRISLTVDGKAHQYPGKLTAVAEGAFIRFIDEVDVEDYLPSVVSAEADGFPAAALEAQAVVSRTFALASRGRHKEDGYDLCDLAHCQVYRGAEAVSAASKDACERTRAEVLLWGGLGLRPAFFHAACAGHTSRAADVFGDGVEASGLGASDSGQDGPACKAAPDFEWTFEVERTDLARGLKLLPEGTALEPLRRDAAGRVLELKAFGKRYRGNEFMSAMGRAFGWQSIRSMKVSAVEVDARVRFRGFGVGHGVGLCQHGAKALALRGLSRMQILQKYFPDCQARAP